MIRTPGRIIAQAKKTGMVALLHMLTHGEDQLHDVYRRSLKLWRHTWTVSQKLKRSGDLDYFIPICRVEKYLRKNHLYLIFNSTAAYGNTEAKRVYSWDEGPIGPMNALLNMAGARLRFLAMTRYPFPRPVKLSYQYKTRDGFIKTESRYGYSGSNRSVKVVLAHPTLQSLDYVDMIRAPLNELCRQLFIHSVSGTDAIPHINLLIYKLRPFLDHIYTRKRTGCGTKVGTARFVERIDEILEEVLTRIRAYHGTRSGRLQRLTNKIADEEWASSSALTLYDIKLQDKTSAEFKSISDLVDSGTLGQADFSRIAGKVLRLAAGSGNRTHRRVSWGLTSPPSAAAAILGGDFHARSIEGYQVCSEVPVWSGQGIADLVLYVRQSVVPEIVGESQAQGIWRPVMVLDLKSKSAFDIGIVGREVKGSKKVVAEDEARKRRMTEDEWASVIDNTPSNSESRQLDLYAKGLVTDYQRLARDDSSSSSIIIQGVIIIDDSVPRSRAREQIQNLIVTVYEEIRRDMTTQSTTVSQGDSVLPKTVYEIHRKRGSSPRIAVVLKPLRVQSDVGILEALPNPSELPLLHANKLFANRVPDSRHFILYVSTGSSGPGRSASWIARYWHGIDYIRKQF
ncbi:MAG: hypothetical protein ACW99J_17150, partial [Candidatus Thorarchaeota archaeon]